MDLSNGQQATVLLWSLVFGAGLGAFFDAFRIFRVFVRSSAVTVLFQDLICFFTAAVASFLFIFEVNDGTVRLFILVAFLLGGIGFRVSVGRLLLHVATLTKTFFAERRLRRTHKQKTSENRGMTVAETSETPDPDLPHRGARSLSR